ncbi:9263_t:CDS:2, partial [Dentiscutata heterogama]
SSSSSRDIMSLCNDSLTESYFAIMEESSKESRRKKQKHSKKKKTDTRKSLTADQFEVAKATISNIVCGKKKWLALNLSSNNADLKRQRAGKFPLLEEALALWVSRANSTYQTITDTIIQYKATQLMEGLEVTGFNVSDGWLSKFKKQYHIKEYKHLGEESGDSPEEITIKDAIDFTASV